MAEGTPIERWFDLLQVEMHQERAAVLGRVGRRVEQAIARCEELHGALDDGDERSVAAYRTAWQAAQRAVADLCIQREAIGLNDHAWVDRIYRVPPPPPPGR